MNAFEVSPLAVPLVWDGAQGKPRIHLGINTCFAMKRWPEPDRWVSLIVDDLGLRHCQLSLDLFEPVLAPSVSTTSSASYARQVSQAAKAAGLTIHSTFTGLAAYSTNLLLHPDREMRDASSEWFRHAIDLTATLGEVGTGGFVGSFSATDAANGKRRAALISELTDRLSDLADYAHRAGVPFLMFENMAGALEYGYRFEEATALERALADRGDPHNGSPWLLCLDLGHTCALTTQTTSDDPTAWLTPAWLRPPVLQIQQSNRGADRHWPFTEKCNRDGLLRHGPVMGALEQWPVSDIYLFLEIIHPAEIDNNTVLRDLRESVKYWRTGALA